MESIFDDGHGQKFDDPIQFLCVELYEVLALGYLDDTIVV